MDAFLHDRTQIDDPNRTQRFKPIAAALKHTQSVKRAHSRRRLAMKRARRVRHAAPPCTGAASSAGASTAGTGRTKVSVNTDLHRRSGSILPFEWRLKFVSLISLSLFLAYSHFLRIGFADSKSAPCTQPPSAPQHLTVGYVDQNVVMLTWQPPRYLGGRSDLVYRVQCDLCVGVTYSPARSSLNQTKVTISNLNPSTSYSIQVYAENGVSDRELSQFAEIKVTTESSGFVSMVVSEDGKCSLSEL